MSLTPQYRGPLFTLARELRDMIYGFYLTTEGGYSLNHQSGKLVTVEGHRIDLALAYTCKTAATEMRNLPLHLNDIHITTNGDEKFRSAAGRYSVLSKRQGFLQSELLLIARPCIDEQILNAVEEAHPHMLPIMHAIKRGSTIPHREKGSSWGEVPSVYRQSVADILQLFSKRQDFKIELSRNMGWLGPTLDEVINLSQTPWTQPPETYLNDMCRIMLSSAESAEYCEKVLYRLSAATVAISFLESLSIDRRRHLRKIVLHEDRVSTSWPECHARGLIPWCLENPRLHIERRVNLWRNVWPAGSRPPNVVVNARPDALGPFRMNVLRSEDISRPSMAPWIMEALSLPSLGMPSQSFNLVLDGSPTLSATARVFKIAQRDAAWQAALVEAFAPQSMNGKSTVWDEMVHNHSYIMRGFPEAIRDITENTSSIISCNFEPDISGNDDQLRNIHPTWTLEDWNKKWFAHKPRKFSTESPLPDWMDLRREEVLPKDSSDSDMED